MKASTLAYLISNLVGLFLFLSFVAGINESIKAEGRDYGDFGDGLNFFMTAVPVFLLCSLYSLIWAVKSAIAVYRRNDYEGVIALVVAGVAWALLLLVLKFCS